MPPASAQRKPWAAFGLLALLFGSCLAYLLYFSLIRAWDAPRASTVTYLVPVVGLLLGVTVLGEAADGRLLAGAALVVAGVAITHARGISRERLQGGLSRQRSRDGLQRVLRRAPDQGPSRRSVRRGAARPSSASGPHAPPPAAGGAGHGPHQNRRLAAARRLRQPLSALSTSTVRAGSGRCV